MGKYFNTTSPKRYEWQTYKKDVSTLLFIREIEIKIKMRFNWTPIRIAVT